MKRDSKKEKLKKEINRTWMNSKMLQKKEYKRNEKLAELLYENKNAEILQTEGGGALETEGMEKTYQISQNKLKQNVDINTQTKIFSLTLDQFGPYRVRFDRPGRHLLMAGERGHIAMMDALKQDLVCEFHVSDSIHDMCFLHDWDMFAVAQKKYLHIYDSQGTELHCLRSFSQPRHLEFLPYHFLLVSSSQSGTLQYLDVSTGETVATMNTKNGPASCMTQNPHNAVILLGSGRGRLSMWCPNIKDAAVTMLCHHGSILSAAVDLEGKYIVTSGVDSHVKIWDTRTYQELYCYTTPVPVTAMALSQTNVLSLAMGGKVNLWRDMFSQKVTTPYMTEAVGGHTLQNMAFRPFEDQLVIGLNDGIRSVVIPGSGEANLDTFELNPFESQKQRRERSVQKLLEKIRPEQIVLDPDSLF